MALLADTKKKVKYGFDPRNTTWSNDESKFGQKLMEKMGWTKGKGLGANEDGNVDHVKAAYKSDSRGLGCTAKDADAWIAHQDDFNELLKNLNSENGGAAKQDKTTVAKEDGRKRYYGRFARGNVATLRSTEDLDCIFGKRKRTRSTSKAEEEAESDSTKEDVTKEHKHGLTTTTSSSSIQDYFAKKMAEKKAKQLDAADPSAADSTAAAETGTGSKGLSGDADKRVVPVFGAVAFSYDDNGGGDSTQTNNSCHPGETAQVSEESGDEPRVKKKTKKKNKLDKSLEVAEDRVVAKEDMVETEGELVKQPKMKKRKKDKEEKDEIVSLQNSKMKNGFEDGCEPQKKKRKKDKKDKDKDSPICDSMNKTQSGDDDGKERTKIINFEEESAEPIEKKKKKKKEKKNLNTQNVEGHPDNKATNSQIEPNEKKKRRRSVSITEFSDPGSNISEICRKSENGEPSERKKKKKKKDEDCPSQMPEVTVSESERLKSCIQDEDESNCKTESPTKSDKVKKKKATKEERGVSGMKDNKDVEQACSSDKSKAVDTENAPGRRRSVSITEISDPGSNISEICRKNENGEHSERKKKKKKSKKRDEDCPSEMPEVTVSESERLKTSSQNEDETNCKTESPTKSDKVKKKKARKEESDGSGMKDEKDVEQACDSDNKSEYIKADPITPNEDVSQQRKKSRPYPGRKKLKKIQSQSVRKTDIDIPLEGGFPGTNISEIQGYGNQSEGKKVKGKKDKGNKVKGNKVKKEKRK